MKPAVLVYILVVSLSNGYTDAFVGSLISGAISTVTGHVSNTVNSISNTVNIATIGGQFLWDNSLKPTLDVLHNNGLNLIDNHFGDILHAIGKRGVSDELDLAKASYMKVTTDLDAHLKDLFKDFFTDVLSQIVYQFNNLLTDNTSVRIIVKKLTLEAIKKIEGLVKATIQKLNVLPKNLNNRYALIEKLEKNLNDVQEFLKTSIKLLTEALAK